MTIVTLAAITVLETVRRRVVALVGGASFLLVLAIGWGYHRIGEAIALRQAATATESVLTILLAFAFSVVLAVGASFLAAPAIAGDLESGIALAILPRPISRTAYVVGKWLGLAALVVGYACVCGALAFEAIAVGSGYRAPHEFAALAYLVTQSVILFTLALSLGTRLAPIAAGIVAVAAFGIGWIAGITAVIAHALGAVVLERAATVAGLLVPTDGLWRGAVYSLTPVALLVVQGRSEHEVNPFAVTAPPTPAFLAWSAIWLGVVLYAGIASMRARDI